ncbi:hypothetical protein LguiA_022613 [Lonicera macranthoides]
MVDHLGVLPPCRPVPSSQLIGLGYFCISSSLSIWANTELAASSLPDKFISRTFPTHQAKPVEALKDQGFCSWNYTLSSLHHHTKNILSHRPSHSHSTKNKKISPHTSLAMVVESNTKIKQFRISEFSRVASAFEQILQHNIFNF